MALVGGDYNLARQHMTQALEMIAEAGEQLDYAWRRRDLGLLELAMVGAVEAYAIWKGSLSLRNALEA